MIINIKKRKGQIFKTYKMSSGIKMIRNTWFAHHRGSTPFLGKVKLVWTLGM
jgi:hypothetical protein